MISADALPAEEVLRREFSESEGSLPNSITVLFAMARLISIRERSSRGALQYPDPKCCTKKQSGRDEMPIFVTFMKGAMMKIDPKDMTRRNRNVLMGSVVVPRPIALVSTISLDGVLNLAPYALFSLICYHPVPMVAFTVMRRQGVSKKDTLVNVEQTKEFVVNVVTVAIAREMNVTSTDFPPEIDEFRISNLTPISSDLVKAPRVAESPINMECRMVQILKFGETEITAEMIIGEVLRLHIRDEIYCNGKVDVASLHAVGRMGAGIYTRTSDLFEMAYPNW